MTPRAAVAELPAQLGESDIVVFNHPRRGCLYHEALYCIAVGNADSARCYEQIRDYNRKGMPTNSGLWNGGFLLRRNNDYMAEVNEAWWVECSRHTMRDQISLPYVLRNWWALWHTLDGSVYDGKYVQVWEHEAKELA